MSDNSTIGLTADDAVPAQADKLRALASRFEQFGTAADATTKRLTDAEWDLERAPVAVSKYDQAIDIISAVASDMEVQAAIVRAAYARNTHVGEKDSVVKR